MSKNNEIQVLASGKDPRQSLSATLLERALIAFLVWFSIMSVEDLRDFLNRENNWRNYAKNSFK